MSEFFEKGQRLLFVFGQTKSLDEPIKKELRFHIKQCIYTPLGLSSMSLLVLHLLRDHTYIKFRGTNSGITGVKSIFFRMILSMLTGTIPATYFYVRLISRADEMFYEGVAKGIFQKKEIRMVEEKEYFEKVVKRLRKELERV